MFDGAVRGRSLDFQLPSIGDLASTANPGDSRSAPSRTTAAGRHSPNIDARIIKKFAKVNNVGSATVPVCQEVTVCQTEVCWPLHNFPPSY